MLFGQFVPVGGWDANADKLGKAYSYKSMKTLDLADARKEELQALDDTAQLQLSKSQLKQFDEIKKIFMNFGFKDKGKTILSIEINQNVLDEMRRERKIMMVLQDANVD